MYNYLITHYTALYREPRVYDYKKLKNQPLKAVLAEFRFSPVMQISEYIPKIQDALRKQYPIPEKKNEPLVQVQAGQIAVSSTDRWAFISANKKSAIDINQERLIYITSEYDRFEGFSNACKQAVDSLITIVEPSLILRIGLRYCDLVTVDTNETLSELVDQQFGYSESFNSLGTAQQQRNETFLHTKMGGLIIRTLYGKNNLTCMPDLQSLPINFKSDPEPSERILLDFDHFWEAKDESINFETSDALDRLSMLHSTSREAFWKVTTDYARNTKWA